MERDIAESLERAYDAAVRACDPEQAVRAAIEVEPDGLRIAGTTIGGIAPSDVTVIALGKAAPAMCRGAESALGSIRGIAASNHAEPCPVELVLGTHPVPDESSARCGQALLEEAASVPTDGFALFLLSGGGSSIAVAPVDGVGVADIAQMNEALLAAGAPIQDINEVRAAVSRLKGGGLAEACSAPAFSLILSDVVGAPVTNVASGPTIGYRLGRRARDVIEAYGLADALPSAVVRALDTAGGRRIEGDDHAIVGSAVVAAESAADSLVSEGYAVEILSTELTGDAARRAIDVVHATPRGTVGIAAGETTVTVRGPGVGGRNQEAALAAAIDIAGSDIVFAALGTDGIDGPTPAAGAIVDGATASRATAAGLDLVSALERNDSHTVLDALGATVSRGDTGTNVGDLWMCAHGARRR